MIDTGPIAPSLAATPPATVKEDPALRKVAEEFEATFIAEMLKHSGVNKTRTGFGGGPGEEAFSSFLTGAYAERLAEVGGIGLAQSIYHALLQKGGQP